MAARRQGAFGFFDNLKPDKGPKIEIKASPFSAQVDALNRFRAVS